MRTYRAYTNEQIISAAKTVKSIAGLLRTIGLKPAGGNYINIKRLLQQLKVDTSHWTGEGWNKGKQLKDWSQYTRVSYLKKHLIKERSLKCETCSLTEWQNSDIPLEVHHKDGDRLNGSSINLDWLCVSCHKKEHYKNNGRRKAFEKGIPTFLDSIISSIFFFISTTLVNSFLW